MVVLALSGNGPRLAWRDRLHLCHICGAMWAWSTHATRAL